MQPKTVVVIDDEADQVELTSLLLQARGHRVFASTDGSQAVMLAANHGADVLLLDFMLGGMTGADVCVAIRAEPKTRGMRIVMLSGTPEGEVRRWCTHYDAFLRKPADSVALFNAL